MSTCDRLELQTLGSQPVLPKNSPVIATGYAQKSPFLPVIATSYVQKSPLRSLIPTDRLCPVIGEIFGHNNRLRS